MSFEKTGQFCLKLALSLLDVFEFSSFARDNQLQNTPLFLDGAQFFFPSELVELVFKPCR